VAEHRQAVPHLPLLLSIIHRVLLPQETPTCQRPPSVLHLGVFLREVGDAAGGWTADGGVHAVMVVAMEPAGKSAGAVGLAGVGAGVGPFVEQGAVEALDLAVGLGPVGPAVLVDDAVLGEGGVEEAAPVGEVVVGQDAFDDDAPGTEPGFGSAPEGGAGGAGLIGEDLGVDEAAVVVDGAVEVGVADAGSAPGPGGGRGPAQDPVAAAGRDLAQLLDVNVDQLAGPGTFVAADRRGGGSVHVREPVEVITDQHPVDRRGRDAEVDREAVGADLVGAATPADLDLGRFGDPQGRLAGSAGAVMETVGAEFQVAVPPLRRAPARDPHRRGHVRDRGAGLDPATQQQSTLRGQRGVTVTHEDLREAVLASTPAHLHPEVFALVDPYRATNVRERNT